MKNLLVTVALLVAPANIYGANKFLLGDRWGYLGTYTDVGAHSLKIKTDTWSVVFDAVNTLGNPIFYSTSTIGTTSFGMHSETCLVDVIIGTELFGELPCEQPLPVGKAWYAGPVDIYQGPKQWFTVTGTEQVRFGGHQYLATIISTIGPLLWAKGKRRSTYWYVPEIKGMMKIVHEGLDENGAVTVEEAFTLTSFQPASRSESGSRVSADSPRR